MDTSKGKGSLSLLSKGVALGFLLVSLICVSVIGYQYTTLKDFERLVVEDLDHANSVQTMNYLFKVQVQEWKNVLLRGHDKDKLDKYWGSFQKREAEIQDVGKTLLTHLSDESSKNKVANFLTAHQKMAAAYRAGLEQFKQSGFDHKAGDQAVSGIDREPAQLLAEAVEMIITQSQNMAQRNTQRSSTMAAVVIPLVLVTVLIIVGGVIYAMNNLVISPLNSLMTGIKRMTQGDYTQPVSTKAKGELAQLANDVNIMQHGLRNMIEDMKSSATVLDDNSQRLQNMMAGMLRQSDEVQTRTELLATATNEMTAASQEVAGNASGAAEAAMQADHSAQDGIKVMNNTIGSINQLADDVQNVASVMNKLASDTSKIGSVLDVIKGIAEQTNLLALNAAIEAARAGEQGRGFAVVADEVRTLAQRTQESTEEIHQIISTVHNGTKDAVQAMQVSQDRTAQCVTLSQQAGETISSVTAAVETIKGMNTQIATAAEEQSSVADEINANINGVAALAQETHESVENSREISQKLSSLASSFRQLSSQYKV